MFERRECWVCVNVNLNILLPFVEEECKKCNEGTGVSGQCFCLPPNARFYKNEKCIPCTAPGYMVDTETGKCVCDTDAGFVVNSEGDGCECDSENHFVPDENGECVCDAANNFVPDGSGGCECDSENHFVPNENGECVCKEGYRLENEVCVPDCSPSITISPDKPNPDVNEVVTFTVEAECFKTDDSEVTFKMSYGDASGDQFPETPTCDTHTCTAETSSPSHAYSYASQFAVTVSLEDSSGTILSTGVVISVGSPTVINNYTLSSCGQFVRSDSGGVGGTIDEWDISAIPPDSKIDVFLETYNIPDRLILQYDNIQQLDTNWVGNKTIFDNNPSLYPGKYAQTSPFEKAEVFMKASEDKFTVFVLAPQSGTRWYYKIRC